MSKNSVVHPTSYRIGVRPKNHISVILPSRNANPDELSRAIESCIGLGVSVCLWFDHDYDEPPHIPNVLYNRLVNVGMGRVGKVQAMNNALAMVKTPYYLYLGDDDYLGAGILELADALAQRPKCSFAYGLQRFIGARNDDVQARQYHGGELYHSNVPLNALLYRTDVARSIGYDDNIHNIEGVGKPEDYDLLLSLHELGHNGIAVPTRNVVIYYTLSFTREWAKMQSEIAQVTAQFKRKHPRFIGSSL